MMKKIHKFTNQKIVLAATCRDTGPKKSFSVEDGAEWLAKMAASDGVVFPREESLLRKYVCTYARKRTRMLEKTRMKLATA